MSDDLYTFFLESKNPALQIYNDEVLFKLFSPEVQEKCLDQAIERAKITERRGHELSKIYMPKHYNDISYIEIMKQRQDGLNDCLSVGYIYHKICDTTNEAASFLIKMGEPDQMNPEYYYDQGDDYNWEKN